MNGRLIIVLFIFLAIAGLVAVVSRLIRVGVTLLALAIILPILCTVLWGDGSSYVSKFASIFTPEIEQRITEGYQFYKEQDSKDPVLDYEQVEEYADGALEKAKDAILGLFGRKKEDDQTGTVFTSSTTGSGSLPLPFPFVGMANCTDFIRII